MNAKEQQLVQEIDGIPEEYGLYSDFRNTQTIYRRDGTLTTWIVLEDPDGNVVGTIPYATGLYTTKQVAGFATMNGPQFRTEPFDYLPYYTSVGWPTSGIQARAETITIHRTRKRGHERRRSCNAPRRGSGRKASRAQARAPTSDDEGGPEPPRSTSRLKRVPPLAAKGSRFGRHQNSNLAPPSAQGLRLVSAKKTAPRLYSRGRCV